MACSFTDHSHSRLFMKPKGSGKVLLFSVVSMVNTRIPASATTLPMRRHESWIAERPSRGSMYEFECMSVCTLWWWRTLL